MESKVSNMEKRVDGPHSQPGNYRSGPAFGHAPARFDLDAAWQRLLQLPLGILGILAFSLLLLAITLPKTTNATIPGPIIIATPTVTPSPTVAPEASSFHSSSSFSSFFSVPAAGGTSAAGRGAGPEMFLLALSSERPYWAWSDRAFRASQPTHSRYQ